MSDRTGTNPLFNENPLKLGIFGPNVSHGCAITTAPGALEVTWANTRRIAELADAAGFEALVPVARWKGFGGKTNFNGTCFETYTWAAGLAALTRRIAVFSTSHVPTVHPILAAKQATTIDHISGGRFALNIVCGWYQPEMEMFGAPIMPHDERYAYASEWVEVVRRLWTEAEEFDHEGRYFRINRGFHEPKPIQHPYPALMNAGGSEAGRHFTAKYCDMAFILLRQHDWDGARAQVDALRRLAKEEYGREIQVWSYGYVVCRPTHREAEEYLNFYVRERGDWEAVENLTRIIGVQSDVVDPDQLEAFKFHFIAGWGGYPLIGTPEEITEDLVKLHQVGLDGCLLSWVNYEDGIQQWRREVLPLMEQAGLRKPVTLL
ncbi:MAG: LLM class flavin-dependent oxidoreductase [Firmicutes bacterium]|nr:LLM class flavin-dependent oxidoreductase [Bacillota bacterium]